MYLKTAIITILTTITSDAWAQSLVITIDESAESYGIDTAQLRNSMSNVINQDLKLLDPSGYMQSMADASVISMKGMGTDYSSSFEKVIFGGAIGSGAHSAAKLSAGGEDLPEFGFAPQLALMAGVDLGVLGEESFFSRFSIFADGLTMSFSRDYFDGRVYNLGAHLQFEIAKGKEEGPIRWGGLDLTGGYELTNMDLELSKAMPISTEGATWDAKGTYVISTSSTSIPIELSTSLHLLVATVYVGGALDINQGDARSTIQLDGDISVDQVGKIGHATVSLSGHGLATESVPRIFGGLQADILFVKIYGHVNYGFNDSFGAHAGLRVAF